MEIQHVPVMSQEALDYLGPAAQHGLLIDCTCGEGGHSEMFLRHFPTMRLIGLDRDTTIQQKAAQRLSVFGERVTLVNTWFDSYLASYDQAPPTAILFDFGISIFHYEESRRGFSFRKDEPLDMRLDDTGELSAADIVNEYPEERLANVIYQYGEERYSRRIASAICTQRRLQWIDSSKELSEIIFHAVPKNYRYGRIHPATRTFQALRIEVNGELDRIERAIEEAVRILAPGGRIGVISFHSLEDRIVKQTFRRLAKPCICPPEQLQCTCDGVPQLQLLNKKPVTAGREEVMMNAPSRSAKFRFARKTDKEQ